MLGLCSGWLCIGGDSEHSICLGYIVVITVRAEYVGVILRRW